MSAQHLRGKCPIGAKKRAAARPFQISSERDVVVHAARLECRRVGRRATPTATTALVANAPEAAVAATTIATALTCTLATAVEQHHGGVEVLQHHFGGVLVLPGLVLPLPGLQLAFDVNLGTLAQILLGNARQALRE